MKMDLEEICRLCAFKVHKPHNIFTTPGLLDKIIKFTDVQIRERDGLPSSICDICDTKLNISDKYRHQANRADKLIRACVATQSTSESNSTQGSSFEEPKYAAPKWLANEANPPDDFEPQQSQRGRIFRERMRLSSKTPWLSRNARRQNSEAARTLIYSYATARSLVASYKALIKRCQSQGIEEEFTLPSALRFSENDNSGDAGDERAVRFAAARRQQHFRKRRVQRNDSLGCTSFRSVYTRITENDDLCNIQGDLKETINSKLPADPLNLLTVKRVQPLADEDSGSCASSTGFSSDAYSPTGFLESYSSDSSVSTVKRNENNFNLPSINIEAEVIPAAGSNPRSVALNECPICNRVFAKIRGLNVHLRVHRSVKCQICETPTITKEKFRDHMRLHIIPAEPQESFQCFVCKTYFKSDIGLKAHMRNHSKSVPAGRACSHCSRNFATYRGYKIHLAKSHTGFESE